MCNLVDFLSVFPYICYAKLALNSGSFCTEHYPRTRNTRTMIILAALLLFMLIVLKYQQYTEA